MNSSRDGDGRRAARSQTAGEGKADDGPTKKTGQSAGGPARGVTQITENHDPIAAALRRVYNDAATEPLPDDLSRLLSRLEAAEKDA